MIRWMVVVAGLVGAAAVGLGAFAAHGLEERLLARGLTAEVVAKRLNTCDIAVRYHLIHAVALLALSLASHACEPKTRTVAAIFFLLGLAMFCGVLYAQAIAGLVGFNLIVPLGGLCFIIGWLCVSLTGFVPPRADPGT